MDEKDVKTKVEAIYKKVLPEGSGEALDFSKTQGDFEGWDSFAHMELVSEVEKIFCLNLDINEATAIQKAQDIVELVLQKGG